jgi:hypothetical protein
MPMKAYCMASTTPHAYKVLMPQYACKPISVPCWSRLMWRRTLVLLHPLPCCHQHFTRGGLCLSPFCVCVCGGGGGGGGGAQGPIDCSLMVFINGENSLQVPRGGGAKHTGGTTDVCSLPVQQHRNDVRSR